MSTINKTHSKGIVFSSCIKITPYKYAQHGHLLFTTNLQSNDMLNTCIPCLDAFHGKVICRFLRSTLSNITLLQQVKMYRASVPPACSLKLLRPEHPKILQRGTANSSSGIYTSFCRFDIQRRGDQLVYGRSPIKYSKVLPKCVQYSIWLRAFDQGFGRGEQSQERRPGIKGLWGHQKNDQLVARWYKNNQL